MEIFNIIVGMFTIIGAIGALVAATYTVKIRQQIKIDNRIITNIVNESEDKSKNKAEIFAPGAGKVSGRDDNSIHVNQGGRDS